MIEALNLEVHGIVQGVGFRPFVYKLAKRHLITGWVLNATAGVFIHAEGESKNLDDFTIEISENAPAAARVDEILIKEVPLEDFTDFSIRYSSDADADATTLVSPDLATCEDCVRELFDPADRRFHYPFINCTNCGPRFTIVDQLPYDRKNTSMDPFAMCPTCASEYADPEDRRFHAQPDACFECGPHISWLETAATEGIAAGTGRFAQGETHWGTTLEESDAIIARAAELLAAGGIVAIKGLGGFHLACDAANPEALAQLRDRKHREGKAFAVMYPSMDAVRQDCEVSAAEEKLLCGPVRPIVLLKKKAGAEFAAGLADGLMELGVMLPYTPLQHLLLAAAGKPLVMTSGNVHNEPIQIDDAQAQEALDGIADAFLGNNRKILCRFDDSVVRVLNLGSADQSVDAVQMIRRARGYAPMPVALKHDATHDAAGNQRTILATGPEQKNTFCLLRGTDGFVSQHVGDMENASTYEAWLDAKNHFERLFKAQPSVIAADMHPEYLSTKWAAGVARNAGTDNFALAADDMATNPPTVDAPYVDYVQHHHAHIVSVMAENDLDDAVIGVAFDGTGYGMDESIWGGEVMLANRRDFERFANFAYVPMPGGAAAIKHPLRMAYGVLWANDLLEHPAAAAALAPLGEAASVCDTMIDRGINSPLTSSVGRLFDAASALLDICTQPSYEGEAAVLLEAAIEPTDETYEITITKNTASANSTAHDTSVVLFDTESLFCGMLDDMQAGVAPGIIAGKFHNAFVQAICQACLVANAAYGITTVALAGGVFMNRYLMEHSVSALQAIGFTVALNKELPPNDGGLSFGQAAVVAARLEDA